MTKSQFVKVIGCHGVTAGAAMVGGYPLAIATGALALGALAYSEKTQKKSQADDTGAGKRGDK